jgi:hypothetical protein
MRLKALIQTLTKGASPFAQRIVALLLLTLVTFLVIDPVWECQDHLDNLRHLGPHGVLLILLAVALAGVSLIRSMRSLLVSFASSILMYLESEAVHRPLVGALVCSLVPEAGPPLRI